MNRLIILCFVISILISCGTSRLTENEAIRLAEKYVAEQGYTDKKIQIDTAKIEPDIVEQVMLPSGILQMRYNTLKPKAVFNSKGQRKWTVGFQNTRDSTRFRIVRIYRNGKRIEMEHQDLQVRTE